MRTPTESAAWLLTALHAARAGASGVNLRALVASADAINHAVIAYSEFKVGLELLLGSQCVAYHGNDFALTEHGADVLRHCGAYRVPTSGHLSRIAESLARLPTIAATSPVTEPVFAEVRCAKPKEDAANRLHRTRCPNPSLHPTFNSRLRGLLPPGELQR